MSVHALETLASMSRSRLEICREIDANTPGFGLDPRLKTVMLTRMAERTRQASARATTREAATAFSRNGASWSEVTALGGEEYRIRLGGMLRAAWMVGVCNGLAREQLSIQRAHARRLTKETTWIAELHVLAQPGASDPLEIRYVDFAEQIDVPAPPTLRLDDYELRESADHGGTLQLTFSAADALGLLGSLLAAFASISLLPVEMHVETRKQRAHDCLWLASDGRRAELAAADVSRTRATGTKPPSASDRLALDALLQRALPA